MVTAVFEIVHHARFFIRHSKNLLSCILFLAGAWTGIAFFLRFILTHPGAKTHDHWVMFGFTVAFVLFFTTYFVFIRAGELWDCMVLLGSATLALPVAIVWDILSMTFIVTQFCLLSASSILLYAFLFSYFQIYPVFQGIERYARISQRILLFYATKLVVVRKKRYRSIVSLRNDLCSKCEAIVDGSALLLGTPTGLAWTSETHQHHVVEELLQSSGGCHLCTLLVRSCSDTMNLQDLPRHHRLSVRIWEERSLSGEVLLRMVLKSQEHQVAAFPLVIEEPLNVNGLQPGRHCHKTNSDAVMTWARATIRTCAKDHETCRNYFVPQEQRLFRPTRLLDVLTKHDTTIKLVETKDIPQGVVVPYLALSHCWGPDGIDFTLVCDKLEDFKRGIHMGLLTKNFQDAVHIARGLEVQYLWIDSLCILQDSLQDLQREIGSMGLLYASADCTIAATASKDSAGGCFRTLDPFIGDCVIRRGGNQSLVATYAGGRGSAVARLFSDRVETAHQAPLSSRGWTFQEQILSSRVLHFCNGVVLFECNTLQSSNFHAEGKAYPTMGHVRTDGRLARTVGPPSRPRPPKPSWPKMNTWPSFSRNYLFIHSTSRVWREGVSTRPASRPAKGHYANINSFRYNRDFKPRSYSTNSHHDFAHTYRSYRKHALWKPTAPKANDMSARLGMRGAFEMLIKFEGTRPDELLEFHNSWYDIVAIYSLRKLTKPEDKLKALAGIAYFIETVSSLQYAYGLWTGGVLRFNLLWMLRSHPEERPLRSVPSWSWASVDGSISHRLFLHNSGKGQVEFLVDQPIVREDGTLLLSGSRTFVPNTSNEGCESSYKFYPDATHQTSSDELVCLPILQLRQSHALSRKSISRLHGIALTLKNRTDQFDLYQRVGYFYIGNGREAELLLQTAARSQNLRIC